MVVTRTVRSAKPGCRSHGNSHTVELPLGGLLRQRTLIAHLPEHTLALSPNRPSFAVGRRMWGYDSDQVLAPRDQRPSAQETLIVLAALAGHRSPERNVRAATDNPIDEDAARAYDTAVLMTLQGDTGSVPKSAGIANHHRSHGQSPLPLLQHWLYHQSRYTHSCIPAMAPVDRSASRWISGSRCSVPI